MRNLRNVGYEEISLPTGLPLTATAWDTNTDNTVCTFGPTTDRPIIELKRRPLGSTDFVLIAAWDAPCPIPDLECDEILLLQYFADITTACLVLAGGDIVVVREEPLPGQERIEIVGSVDVGIAAAAWAPDEELLAIVTCGDTLVLMSRDFEPVTETTLSADDLNASKHVSVGWGKKETQFQGKRAKAMRDPTVPDSVDEGRPSPYEDGKTQISWRGDGQYFAINNVVPQHRRVIRVFNREAVLDSASEPVDGLESAISWRPYGNLIAGVKRSPSRLDVVFFERNGLRHGEFDLRLSQDEMASWARNVSLSWNLDSSVLAVGYLDRVQLWTMGNYHYYLKQEIIQYRPPPNPITALSPQWHPESPLRIQFSDSHSHRVLCFQYTVNRGSVITGQDYGAVAVIDGKTLKLTPLRQAGVPPPMSFCDVNFEHNIVDCAFSEDCSIVAVLTTHSLHVCRWETLKMNGSRNTAHRRFSTTLASRQMSLDSSSPGMLGARRSQVLVCGDDIYVLAPAQRGLAPSIERVSVNAEELTNQRQELELDPSVQNLILDTTFKHIAALGNRKCQTIYREGSSESDSFARVDGIALQPDAVLYENFPLPHSDDGLRNGNSPDLHLVSMSTKGVLMADNTSLARDCTSFVVTDAHIIFTTSQHLLKFVHLTDPEKMKVPGNTPESDERCRSIERGAKIVTVMPSSYAVVLQMPRGNLETVYPRVLVLAGIRRHISELDYKTAFLACQSQQVDMNILFDYQPYTFLSNISTFIQQLKKPTRIDEFLSKLKDEDVTKTLYRDTLTNVVPQEQPDSPSPKSDEKVNKICSAFISALATLPPTPGFTQNTITAHVCKRPADLDSALTLVSDIHKTSPESADLAISHLCFLTDTTRLYNAALALYDLEVALLVAQNAQRDPREYMPFLQDLHSLPQLQRQYKIDHHLKNHTKALTSLHGLNDHPAVEAYTLKHLLFPHALTLYQPQTPHHTTLTRHYAAHLASTSQPLQAATLYDSLSDHSAAYPLYALAGSWREALTSATLLPLPTPQLSTLATSLADTLTTLNHDYRSAAHIHEHFLSSPLTAATLLCKGTYFADATLLLARTPSPPPSTTIPQIIDPSLTSHLASLLALLSDTCAQLAAQLPRIAELRQIKASNPLAFYGGEATTTTANGDNIPDDISLAPTDTTVQNSLFTRAGSSRFGAGTVSSNASRKTAKTKRKEERKRARGKKGSVYEEEYLVESVKRVVERWNGVFGEVGRVVVGLRRRGRSGEAKGLEEGMREMEGVLRKGVVEVWGSEEEGAEGKVGVDAGVEARPSGADGVFWDSLQSVVEGEGGRRKRPEIKVWKGEEGL